MNDECNRMDASRHAWASMNDELMHQDLLPVLVGLVRRTGERKERAFRGDRREEREREDSGKGGRRRASAMKLLSCV